MDWMGRFTGVKETKKANTSDWTTKSYIMASESAMPRGKSAKSDGTRLGGEHS